jgi:hypothetical protein
VIFIYFCCISASLHTTNNAVASLGHKDGSQTTMVQCSSFVGCRFQMFARNSGPQFLVGDLQLGFWRSNLDAHIFIWDKKDVVYTVRIGLIKDGF